MEQRLSIEYEDRIKCILKIELNVSNKVKFIYTHAAPALIKSFRVIKWPNTNLENIFLKTQNLLIDFHMLDKNSCIETVMLPKK